MIAYSDDVNELKKKQKANAFNVMDLEKDLLSGLNRMGYKVPTPVQRKTLPIALAGMDAVCMARTGSGKTAAFLIPMLQKIGKHESAAGVRGVILSPTRELAVQTFRFAKDMAKFMDLRIVSIIGGDPLEPQFEALANRPDVIVATPGRLMHHLQEISTFKLNTVKHLVFDEADRLFEMGFAEQLNEIIKQCPEDRQTLLFSATMPRQLIQFTRAGLHDPQLIRLESDNRMSDELRMAFLTVRSNEKMAGLIYLVRKIIPATDMTIVFTATKHHSEYVHALFQKLGVTSTIVYGTMDQDARSSNLKAFRNGSISYLIVTDLAARGIDVPLLNNVINLHFPPSPKLFVHRCGRAARQGRIGYVIVRGLICLFLGGYYYFYVVAIFHM
jgi:ATP-dependent RNA helicase DDX54/DBP10